MGLGFAAIVVCGNARAGGLLDLVRRFYGFRKTSFLDFLRKAPRKSQSSKGEPV